MKPLPGVAPVAMQEGQYVAALIQQRLMGSTLIPSRYFDRGSLAVIGRECCCCRLAYVSGFLAWLAWLFVHITFLIEFDNKLVVLIQWAGTISRKRGARLITGEDSLLVELTPMAIISASNSKSALKV